MVVLGPADGGAVGLGEGAVMVAGLGTDGWGIGEFGGGWGEGWVLVSAGRILLALGKVEPDCTWRRLFV